MSDLPPPTSTFVDEQVTESVDELINVSALKKIMKEMMRPEIEVMLKQMMKPQLEVMVIRIFRSSIVPIMGDSIRRILQEKLEEAVQKYLVRDQGENEVQTSPRRRFSLRFRNEPFITIYTGREIKAKDGTPVEVELVDLDSGQVVESGPEAEANAQIVPLEGADGYDDNWTSEVFDSKIVGERKGTKLSGNVIIKLDKGKGVVENVKFVSSKTHMPQGVFKLGIRMLGAPSGIHIGEGKSTPFTVKDFRNFRTENNKKSEIPQLTDEVWRLRKIPKNKKIHNNLKEQDIHTVKDFLLKHFKDPQGLKCIAGMRKNKDWEDTVSHARTCELDQNISCYIDPQENNGVAFNLVDQVLGLVSGPNYIPVDRLSDHDKAKAHSLALFAIENGKDLLPFDDEAFLVSYLSSSFGSFNPVVPHSPENSRIQNNDVYNPLADPSFEGATLIINSDRGSPITIHWGESVTYSDIDDQPLSSQGSFSLPDTEIFQGVEDEMREKFPYCQFQRYELEANTEHENSNGKSKADNPRVSKWVVLSKYVVWVNRLRGSMVKKRAGLENLPVGKRQKTDSNSIGAQSAIENSFLPGTST